MGPIKRIPARGDSCVFPAGAATSLLSNNSRLRKRESEERRASGERGTEETGSDKRGDERDTGARGHTLLVPARVVHGNILQMPAGGIRTKLRNRHNGRERAPARPTRPVLPFPSPPPPTTPSSQPIPSNDLSAVICACNRERNRGASSMILRDKERSGRSS